MHSINIKNLAVDTIIGVYEHEKHKTQRLYLSVLLNYDFQQAMLSDDLNDTLDYAMLSQELKEIIENNRFELIERVGGVVADILENRYSISQYRIEISKPSALEQADSVGIIIDSRKRHESK